MGFFPCGVMMGGDVPGVLILVFLRCLRGFVFIVAGAVGLVEVKGQMSQICDMILSLG